MILGRADHSAVVLLGAGATRGAFTGIGRAKIYPPLNRDFFEVARKFCGTTDGRSYKTAFERLDTFIEKEMRLKATEKYTMEQVFNVLFLSKELPAVFSGGGRRRQAGFRREVADFFRLVVGLLRFVQLSPRHPKNVDHHRKLAQALQPGDSVISLNYDTLMDNALLAQGWDPRTGYGFSASNKVSFQGAPRPPFKLADVLLLKPHGSLNWFARGSFENYEDVLLKQKPSLLLMSPVPRAYDIAAAEMVRFFVPPLYAKFFSNRFWRSLWETAFSSLLDAEMLLIIGCSMIETDFHLRAIMGRALSRRKRKFERLIIVDPHPSRLKSFLRGRSSRGIETYGGFTQLVTKLLS